MRLLYLSLLLVLFCNLTYCQEIASLKEEVVLTFSFSRNIESESEVKIPRYQLIHIEKDINDGSTLKDFTAILLRLEDCADRLNCQYASIKFVHSGDDPTRCLTNFFITRQEKFDCYDYDIQILSDEFTDDCTEQILLKRLGEDQVIVPDKLVDVHFNKNVYESNPCIEKSGVILFRGGDSICRFETKQ